jgi:hypothetical protein
MIGTSDVNVKLSYRSAAGALLGWGRSAGELGNRSAMCEVKLRHDFLQTQLHWTVDRAVLNTRRIACLAEGIPSIGCQIRACGRGAAYGVIE